MNSRHDIGRGLTRLIFWLLSLIALTPFCPIAQAIDGDLDPTFGGSGKVTVSIVAQQRDFARAVAVQSDGKIIVGGELGDYSSNSNSSALVRLKTDGNLDQSFGSGGKVVNASQLHISSLALQPDGKIVTAAATANLGINLNFVVVRYNPDGTLDQNFGNGGYAVSGEGNANWVLLQPDGKILLIGYLVIYRNGSDLLLARFNADGSPDQTFGNGGRVTTSLTSGLNSSDVALCAALQSDGKIVVSGSVSCISVALVRYNPDGTIDSDFGLDGQVFTPNFGGNAARIAIQADGKIVIGGGAFVLARYNGDGKVDRSFGIDGKISGGFGTGSGSLHAISIEESGRILAAGSVSYNGTGNANFVLARYTADGFPDPSFGTNGFVITQLTNCLDEGNDLAIQPDNKLVVAGYTSEPGCSNVDFAITRYLSTTPKGPPGGPKPHR